jgi:hypothetical protein
MISIINEGTRKPAISGRLIANNPYSVRVLLIFVVAQQQREHAQIIY